MIDKSKAKTWCGNPITHEKDANDLDRMAAVHEFSSKMPRDLAEQEAYRTYQKSKHVEGAAFHLGQTKAARGMGDNEAAKKHNDLYSMHVKALGHNPIGPVPEEVQAAHVKQVETDGYKSKSHPSDSLLLDGAKKIS